jgi:hypothetical protein
VAVGNPSNKQQQIYNINPNTPGSLLLPAVQGVMDTSVQWPLNQQLKVFDYTAAAGTNSRVLSAPPNQFHELLISAYFTISVGGTAQSVLFTTNAANSGPTANQGISRILLSATLTQVPLIGPGQFYGGSVVVTGTTAPFYVPFPYTVTHSVVGAAGGESVTLRTISLRLPASQPLQALLELF